MKRFLIGGLAAAAILSAGYGPSTVAAAQKLEMQITPSVCVAPAYVVVRVMVPQDSQNRELEIIADSMEYYRKTVIELDGDRAPRVHESRLFDVPSGEYEITATLLDAVAGRAVVRRTLMVRQ